ncbi:MAG: hypothetical protein EAY65_05220 [Alphaproteobacteria bacterium]|nr:MAG: hypothetical protein EAY65_05220 [Alphaproteobacteria bacterium]
MMQRDFPSTSDGHPVIGVSCHSALGVSTTALITQLKMLGAVPVILDWKNADAAHDAAHLDGVIVMGSPPDINPAEYGHAPHPQSGKMLGNDTPVFVDPKRADYENQMIDAALEHGVPFMSVCQGFQRLNVRLGATLHQHVPELLNSEDEYPTCQIKNDIPLFVPTKWIGIKQDSQLGRMGAQKGYFAPDSDASVDEDGVIWHYDNALHHQAVQMAGDGLMVNAVSEDGLIYGVEADPAGKYAGQFILGIQFHPEFSASMRSLDIMAAFTEAARDYARQHPHEERLSDGVHVSAQPSERSWRNLAEIPNTFIADAQNVEKVCVRKSSIEHAL